MGFGGIWGFRDLGNLGILEFRDLGILEFRDLGIFEFRDLGLGVEDFEKGSGFLDLLPWSDCKPSLSDLASLCAAAWFGGWVAALFGVWALVRMLLPAVEEFSLSHSPSPCRKCHCLLQQLQIQAGRDISSMDTSTSEVLP